MSKKRKPALEPPKAPSMQRAVEKYYSVAEVALLLSFSDRWVRDRIHDKSFPNAIDLSGELRVPASDINNLIEKRRLHVREEPGIAARSIGELRRKTGHVF